MCCAWQTTLPSSCVIFRRVAEPHLQVYLRYVLAQWHAGGAVNDLYPDGGVALGFQCVVHQVLGGKVDVASPMRVVLAQHTLWVQTAKAPTNTSRTVARAPYSYDSQNDLAEAL